MRLVAAVLAGGLGTRLRPVLGGLPKPLAPIRGQENNWRCRAGARYLYICEDGLVHYCSQQRGYPAKPLDEYTNRSSEPRHFVVSRCVAQNTVLETGEMAERQLTEVLHLFGKVSRIDR